MQKQRRRRPFIVKVEVRSWLNWGGEASHVLPVKEPPFPDAWSPCCFLLKTKMFNIYFLLLDIKIIFKKLNVL